MERPRSAAARWVALVLVGLVMVPAAGCTAGAMAMYLIKGTNVPGEYEELKHKRVLVVCRPTASLQYSNASVSKQLARLVSLRLDQNIRKIDVVDPRDVEAWTDENDWDDFTEVGEALKAEVVIAIELDQFSLYQGQTLYQGRANATVTVYEVAGGDVLFEKSLPQIVFPPNSGIPASDRPEGEFRAQFLQRLADQLGNLFYPHDAHNDIAVDSMAL